MICPKRKFKCSFILLGNTGEAQMQVGG